MPHRQGGGCAACVPRPLFPQKVRLKSSSGNRHAANGSTGLGDYSFSFYLVKEQTRGSFRNWCCLQPGGGKQGSQNAERRSQIPFHPAATSHSFYSCQVKPNVNLAVGKRGPTSQHGACVPRDAMPGPYDQFSLAGWMPESTQRSTAVPEGDA